MGHVLKNLPVGPYLTGTPVFAAAWEQGWKDTTQAPPRYVTTFRIRFARKDGKPFSFNPKLGPGYVYHCHILSHEDNDMMRPMRVV
jgi:spore coat protein A